MKKTLTCQGGQRWLKCVLIILMACPLCAAPPKLLFVSVSDSLQEAQVTSYCDAIESALQEGELKHVVLELAMAQHDKAQLTRLSDYCYTLKAHGVVTVAFVKTGADPAAATFIALSCREIALATGVSVGGLNDLVLDNAERARLSDRAKEFNRPWALIDRMARRGDACLAYEKLAITGERSFCFLSPAQYEQASDADKAAMAGSEPVTLCAKGEPLLLDTRKAKQYGIAQFVVTDRDDLLIHLGLADLREDQIREAGKSAFSFSQTSGAGVAACEFLQTGFMRFLLITVGIVCIFLEFQVPGLGIPGLISLVCFGAFFTSGIVTGYVSYFEMGLFVVSLILIGLEILVIPGFGVTGIAGATGLLVSLVLAMYKTTPGVKTYDWDMLGDGFFTTLVSMCSAIGLMMLMARFLPESKLAKRQGLVLSSVLNKSAMRQAGKPEADTPGDAETGQDEGEAADWPVGLAGVSVTSLRPAGKARVGDRLLDVVSGTDYIEAGTEVVVVRKEGPKTVVMRKEDV